MVTWKIHPARRFTSVVAIIQSIILITLPVFCGQGAVASVPDVSHIKVKDPYFGEALLYFYQGDYLSSLIHLMAFEKMQQLPSHKEDSDLLLGISQLYYGMKNEAKDSFARILSNRKYSQISRDMAGLYLAETHYNQGELALSDKILSSIGNTLPAHLEKRKKLLQADSWINKGRYQDAEKALSDVDGDREIETLRWYGQHNLGVTMLRNGQVEQGARVLYEISSETFNDVERRALQDKTNLALGYAYLQAGDMNSATGYFERIRIKGPFSSQALLGLGFAEAAMKRYQRALIPWGELQTRDIREVEVREALLMIPETLFKLESYRKSQSDYQSAVSRYQAEIESISAAIDAVHAGRITRSLLAPDMFDGNYWNNFTRNSQPLSDMHYFSELMQDVKFREVVFLYREAIDLHNTMNVQTENLGSYGLGDIVTARYADRIHERTVEVESIINKLESHIQMLAINWLENRKTGWDAYLTQAKLGLAKVYRHAAERGSNK